MPLDYNEAPNAPARRRRWGRSTATRWLPPWSATWLRAASRSSAPRRRSAARRILRLLARPQATGQQSVVTNVAAEVVDRFLAGRGAHRAGTS